MVSRNMSAMKVGKHEKAIVKGKYKTEEGPDKFWSL